jgi:hypothetical protein
MTLRYMVVKIFKVLGNTEDLERFDKCYRNWRQKEPSTI